MTDSDTDAVQGEGDYISAKKFQDAQHAFAEKPGAVDKAAHEAADALDGPEGEELEGARLTTAKGEPVRAAEPANSRDEDDKIDDGLKQTFPASDPAPTSPGAD